jgi:hypothetical protein
LIEQLVKTMVVVIAAMVLVLGLIAITILNNNNVYAVTVEESQIEIKNLTRWQWDQVKYSMNFTGIEIPDWVKE